MKQNIYPTKAGVNYGPYTESEIRSRMRSGEYSGCDLAWVDESSEPVPLSSLFPNAGVAKEDAAAQPPDASHLWRVQRHRLSMISLACFWVGFGFFPWPTVWLHNFFFGGFWAIHFMGVYRCCRLAHQLHKQVWLYLVLTLIPLVNLFAFARLVNQAGKFLKAEGQPVD